MGNALFSKGREGILDRSIDMTGDVRAMLVKAGYVFDDSDMYVSDLGDVDNGRTGTFGMKTYTNGVFDAPNITLVATAAEMCSAIVIFQHTGDDLSARLIAYIDSPASGLPCTPAAGQILNLAWDSGSNKIFKL